MRQIEQALIVGIGMDRGHGGASDAESVLDDLRYWREKIGGSVGIGNDVVLCRIVALIVHTKDKGGVGSVGGRGDDDLLHRSAEMLSGIGPFGEQAGGFHNDFRSNRHPIEFGGMLYAENFGVTSVDLA